MTKTQDNDNKSLNERNTLPPQLEERITTIRQRWAALRDNWDPVELVAIHAALSELAEYAGVEGFSSLADAAFSAEVYLSSFVGVDMPLTPDQRESAGSLLAELTADHERDTVESSGESAPVDPDEVYLVGPMQDSLQAIADILKGQGVKLHHQEDAAAALGALQHSLPALLVTDVNLIPDIELLLEELAHIHKTAGKLIPILYVSDTDRLELRIKAIRAGGMAFLTPPFNTVEIGKKLSELRDRSTVRDHRILVVEDDSSQAEFTASILNKAGFETTIVTDPMQTLDRLREFAPDLIIMDIYMPEVDGIELTSIIREYNEYASIPIIFLSGEQDTERQVDALSVGGDDFITKPIRPKQLIAIVDNRIRRSVLLRRAQYVSPDSQLLTKVQFLERITTLLSTDPMHVQSTGILLLSPDNGALLNKQLGSDAFKQLIIEVAREAERQLEERDAIGQLDEHALGIACRRHNDHEVRELATRLHEAVAERGFRIRDTSHSITAGIGLAFASHADNDANNLINHARVALQQALDEPPGRTVVYDKLAGEATDAAVETGEPPDDFSDNLRGCLEDDSFVVLFQPLLDLQERGTENYEIILRMPTPNGDLLAPNEIRVKAERAGLAESVDKWLLGHALDVLRKRRTTEETTRLFICQSGSSLLDPTYPDWLAEQLREHHLVGTGLVLDFPLSSTSHDLKTAQQHINMLHKMDIAVCLSQFPEKPAAFKLLRYVRGDYIRIAKRLLKTDRQTITSIVSEAHQAKAKVIISHIDDPRSIDLHWSSGGDLLQGDFIQPPIDSMDYDFSQVVI